MFGIGAKAWKAGVAYFGIVFGAGFIFGVIRQIWAIPRFGSRVAELAEMPFMLIVIFFAARWVVSRAGLLGERVRQRLIVGLSALGLLLVAELTLVLWLRGLTLSEYLETRDPVAGAVYLLMLGIYALMPVFVSLRGRVSR